MSDQDDSSDKSFEPTPEKIKKAREQGNVAKSADLSLAAAYMGLAIAFYISGSGAIQKLGVTLKSFIDQPDRMVAMFFDGSSSDARAALLTTVMKSILPWFIVPASLVLLSILAQKAFVVAPSKIKPKLSKISIISNAKNKFGRSGLFEFLKSFLKLLIYTFGLGYYLSSRMPELIASAATGALSVIMLMGDMVIQCLIISVVISAVIGVVDAGFQHAEFRRRNMMSRKEVTDEQKNSEGDPHFKGQRRQRGQAIALGQMIAAVPDADVVIVNPTHYAVVLKWSREQGAAPSCVAKGVDEMAAAIREKAQEHGVPIHSDPPTARALYASVEIGQEIEEEHYAPVAAAIRFAESMRERAKGKI
ncbi:flagellar type III secretion system protein FlhB [Epibacterium sp. SM1969]|uniref:Flagellar type III secretion system protein FlhB n=1 Tax=Tritonibacter aquimaris TaxID=2663379 RepID=A0A844AK74_9RHOB|nr:flagellar type III secretion system protein FlhB [Tritonibacter aquimaris]MQY41980.1 flagellar type III secretion system protein FlhB [Tritonibacter aquimaris]